MPNPKRASRLEEDICIHIFTVSAGLVGVCLTVIGLLRVVITLRKADTFADDLSPSTQSFFWSPACLRIGRCARAVCNECIESNDLPIWFFSSLSSLWRQLAVL